MFKIATSLLLVALMISLAGPAAADDKPVSDKGLGLVVQNNIAAMVVDLTPSYANVKIEGSDGLLADGAVTRYRTGRVKALIPFSGRSNLGDAAGASTGAATSQPQAGPR
jgi:type IV pilus biogenesis protein CpaD/CtpE